MKKIYLFCLLAFFTSTVFARYVTPGTGVSWTLPNLVANSGGAVTLVSGNNYQVADTIFISLNDTLNITADATLSFAAATYFDVNGVININPPTKVTFTASNTTSGYLGMRIDSSNGSLLRNFTMEYAVALRLADCSPIIDNCIFRFNNNSTSTAFGTSAITLFRSSPLITGCQFLNNQRAAISGGSNINNAPRIYNCLFSGNNTQNANVPQINLGATGTDTAKIINNQLLRASTNSGGIGFLPTGTVNAVISGNVIKNNRYGLTFNGGSNINVLVSYNQIDSNNTQNDPALGGSGIAFSGGTATSHQNVIVTGNLIRWNLWGITIGATSTGGGAKPNLGNIANTDTTDDGKNQIYGNNNASTPNIDLYNNNVDSIYAQNNYWGSSDVAMVESHIFHKPDNTALGIVIYQPLFQPLPIKLLSFSALVKDHEAVLYWQTASEINNDYFNIERSEDGRNFSVAGRVGAANSNTTTHSYRFTDPNPLPSNSRIYYRLKQVDKDGRFTYSAIVKVVLSKSEFGIAVYPNPVKDVLALSVMQNDAEKVSYTLATMDGRVLTQQADALTGSGVLNINALATQPAGTYLLKVWAGKEQKVLKVYKQ